MGVSRVVSGGQTGADRAGLDAALRLGLAHGGWCPAGGAAEDGLDLLAAYPDLRETPSADPSERTAWNVRDSDASLVLSFGDPRRSPGTAYALEVAARLGRPVLAARPALAARTAGTAPAGEVRRWLAGLPDRLTLNVAGPRESEEPGLHAATLALLLDVLA